MYAPTHIRFSPLRQRLARKLLEIGAVRFTSTALRLADQEQASPIHINLHTRWDPKPGPLTAEALEMIGKQLHEDLNIQVPWEYVVGDPTAGDPIAAAFVKARRIPTHRTFQMEKREIDGRWFKNIPRFLRAKRQKAVLLVDDVLTRAVGKLGTIQCFRSYHFTVPFVGVVIIRDDRGADALLEAGVKTVVSVFALRDLLDYYVNEALITPLQYDASCTHLGYR